MIISCHFWVGVGSNSELLLEMTKVARSRKKSKSVTPKNEVQFVQVTSPQPIACHGPTISAWEEFAWGSVSALCLLCVCLCAVYWNDLKCEDAGRCLDWIRLHWCVFTQPKKEEVDKLYLTHTQQCNFVFQIFMSAEIIDRTRLAPALFRVCCAIKMVRGQGMPHIV